MIPIVAKRPNVSAPPFTRFSSNRDDILQRDLASSPAVVDDAVSLHLERGHPSAAQALNPGLDATDGEVVVFVHQDVYLPAGWDQRLVETVDQLETDGIDRAVLGVAGMQADGRFGRSILAGSSRCSSM